MTNEIKLGNTGPLLGSHKPAGKAVTADDKPSGTGQAAGIDRVSVTDTASRLQKIEEELSAMPEINHEKVAEIKKAIADGTFSLDPQRIADKLIGFETSFKR